MREKIDDELLRHFFANDGQTLATEDFCYPLMSTRTNSADSLVTRGLEFGRFSKQDNEFDDFFNITKTRNLSLADISILSHSQAYWRKMDSRPQQPTNQNTKKRTFVPYERVRSSTHHSWLRNFSVILFLVLTLGIISPSPLTRAHPKN